MISEEQKKAAKEAAQRLEAKFPGVNVGIGIMKSWWGKLIIRLFVFSDNLPDDFPKKWEGYKIEFRGTVRAL